MGAIDDGFEALLEPFYNGKSLTDPISTKEDKYQLLPAFLKVKGGSLRHQDPLGRRGDSRNSARRSLVANFRS
jgi:hypothetical protein